MMKDICSKSVLFEVGAVISEFHISIFMLHRNTEEIIHVQRIESSHEN